MYRFGFGFGFPHRNRGPIGIVTTSGLSAPTLDYPTPLASNPTTVPIHIPVDWQSGDVLNLARSTSVSMTGSTLLSHTLTDADITAGTISMGIPTLSGVVYSQSYGSRAGADSTNKSNIVAWGDTTAPVITTSASQSVVETSPLAVSLTGTDTGGIAAWSIEGGPDQLQFEISGTTLRFANNGAKTVASAQDQGLNNVYDVLIGATDYGGNKTTLSIAVTVTAADLTPDAFTFTDVSGATLSTLYTSNTVTIAGLTSGVNAPFSVSAGEYQKNGGAWTPAGSFTVQNGDTIAVRQTSSASYLTGTTQTVVVGTFSESYVVTTAADASAASFSASTTQPAPQNLGNATNIATFSAPFVAGYPLVCIPAPPSGRTVSSVTVNGVALTARTPGVISLGGIWVGTATVAAGTYNVVVTYSAVVTTVAVMTGSLVNTTNPVPTAWADSTYTVANTKATSGALTVPSQGVGIAFCEEQSPTNAPTADTGTLVATGMVGQFGGTNANGGLSRQATAGSWTPSFSMGGTGNYMYVIGMTFANA